MFIFLFLVSAAMATDHPVVQIWRIKAAEIKLTSFPQGGLINLSCLANIKCKADAALTTKSENIPSLNGGTNPGSTVCKTKKGIVMFAENNHNTQA